MVPAPSAPNDELKFPAKFADAFVARTVSSTVSPGTVPVVLMVGASSFTKTVKAPVTASPSPSVAVNATLIVRLSSSFATECAIGFKRVNVYCPLGATTIVHEPSLAAKVALAGVQDAFAADKANPFPEAAGPSAPNATLIVPVAVTA